MKLFAFLFSLSFRYFKNGFFGVCGEKYVKRCYRVLRYLTFVPVVVMVLEQVVWGSSSQYGRIHHDNKVHEMKADKMMTGNRQVWSLPPKKLFVSPLTGLPTLADGQTALPSNANNFHGAWSSTVDPRTGSVMFSMTAGSFLYSLAQARRDLVLSYTGGISARGPDTFGLGSHWSWNLGIERPSTSEVAGHLTTDVFTGDGHGFTMISGHDRNGHRLWHPLRHKIRDVFITGSPGNWTISLATGVREKILNGYEKWEENQEGKRVWFYYDHEGFMDGKRHLLYICAHPLTRKEVNGEMNACPDQGVRVTYAGNTATVHGRQTLKLYWQHNAGVKNLDRISLPSLSSKGEDNSEKNADIFFNWDNEGNRPWLLRGIQYPTGNTVTFLYNNESDRHDGQSHGLPVGINNASLPVVTEQIQKSNSAAIADRKLWYSYGSGADRHNYTGYQGDKTVIPGKDNLMDRADSYTYSVTVDNGKISKKTTYNKYHLPLTVTLRDDTTGMLLEKSDQTYPRWKQTTFDQLSSVYSFPLRSTKYLYGLTGLRHDSGLMSTQVVRRQKYNERGQIVWQRDAYGREIFTRYCPEKGDKHCPSAEPGWSVISRPEKVMIIPATHSRLSGKESAKAVEVVFDYIRLPVHHDMDAALMKGRHHVLSATPSFFWEVGRKTTGTVDLQRIGHPDSEKELPELLPEDISSRVDYQYDTGNQRVTYGQLSGLKLEKLTPTVKRIKGRLFNIAGANGALTSQRTVTVNVSRHVDLNKRTLSTTMMAVSPNHSKSGWTQNDMGAGIRFGSTVYSLVTGARMESEDAMHTMRVIWSYDNWGRPVRKTMIPVNGGKPLTVDWHYILTGNEMSVVSTGPDGNQRKVVYGEENRVVATLHRFRPNVQKPMKGFANWIPDTKITYTATGKVARRTIWHAGDKEGALPGKAVSLTTSYGYDSLDRPVWQKNPDGTMQFFIHVDPAMWEISYRVALNHGAVSRDGIFPVVSVSQGNILGKPVATCLVSLDPEVQKKGRVLYSPVLQQKLREARWIQSGKNSFSDQVGSSGTFPGLDNNRLVSFIKEVAAQKAWLICTHFNYDGLGRRIRQMQGNGAETRWLWQNGNLAATVNPDGSLIHDEYDVQGNKVSRCMQANNGSVCYLLGTRAYDSMGNVIRDIDESGHVIRYEYDVDGRLITKTMPATAEAPAGHVFAYRYNSIGLTEERIDGKPYVKYEYDPVSWRLTDREDSISHLHYEYDRNTGWISRIIRTRPVTFTSPLNIHYPPGIQTFKRDRYGHLTSYEDQYGNEFTTVHDTLSRVVVTKVRLPGHDRKTVLARISYDRFGRLAREGSGAGVIRTFRYNAQGRVATVADRINGQLSLEMDYAYDPDTGNIVSMVRKEHEKWAKQVFHYDLMNNLVSMACNGTGGGTDLCPADTGIGGSSLVVPPVILSQQYAFDRWNNISKVSEKLFDRIRKRVMTKNVVYVYAGPKGEGANGQQYDPHQMRAFGVQWSDQSYSTPLRQIRYDELGRMISDAEGNRLHYNAQGLQDRFVNVRDGMSTRYLYDSDGHQVAEQTFNRMGIPLQNPLYMFYQGGAMVSQLQADARGKLHSSVEMGSIARSEDGVINRWYLHDYKGDVLSVLNSRGEIREDNLYSPYGMKYDRLHSHGGTKGESFPANGQIPWWQSHKPGFDGQMTDPATGYQFLGGGYRAYNPVYRHFLAKDSYSPFIKMDGYGFGDNNPVMNIDPDGHLPLWASSMIAGMGIVGGIAMSILMPVVAAGSAGFSLVALGATLSAVATGLVGATSGSLQAMALAYPERKDIEMASDLVGIANGIGLLHFNLGAIIGGIKMISAVTGLARITGGLILSSGVAGIHGGLFDGVASGMKAGIARDENLSYKSGIKMAITILNGISMALQAGSALISTGAVATGTGSKLFGEIGDGAQALGLGKKTQTSFKGKGLKTLESGSFTKADPTLPSYSESVAVTSVEKEFSEKITAKLSRETDNMPLSSQYAISQGFPDTLEKINDNNLGGLQGMFKEIFARNSEYVQSLDVLGEADLLTHENIKTVAWHGRVDLLLAAMKQELQANALTQSSFDNMAQGLSGIPLGFEN